MASIPIPVAEDGRAIIEIYSNTHERITVTLNNHLKALAFPDSSKEKFHFFHSEHFPPNNKLNYICDIDHLI